MFKVVSKETNEPVFESINIWEAVSVLHDLQDNDLDVFMQVRELETNYTVGNIV